MRRITLLAAVLCGLLVLTGCGIESFILLNPPTAYTYGGIGQFKFRATADNSEGSFKGFEVYYKIYQQIDSPEITFETFDNLIAAGFRRINKADDVPGSVVTKPLIAPAAADIGTNYNATIDFSLAIPELQYPTISTDAGTAPRTYYGVRRGVSSGLGDFKNFLQAEFADGDNDATAGAIDDIQGGTTQIIVDCFALSYGIDLSSGLEVYSQPVWLGNGSFVFPY